MHTIDHIVRLHNIENKSLSLIFIVEENFCLETNITHINSFFIKKTT